MRKYKDVLESPNELKIAARILYINKKGSPVK